MELRCIDEHVTENVLEAAPWLEMSRGQPPAVRWDFNSSIECREDGTENRSR